MRYEYPAKIRRKGTKGYVLEILDVPEVRVAASTSRLAQSKAISALTTALAEYVLTRTPVPTATPARSSDFVVPVPLLLAAKLALYQALNRARISKKALASKLGVTEAVVTRLLNPEHASRIDRLEAALAELGVCLVAEDTQRLPLPTPQRTTRASRKKKPTQNNHP